MAWSKSVCMYDQWETVWKRNNNNKDDVSSNMGRKRSAECTPVHDSHDDFLFTL